ncbi:hypothetical protein BJV74DRAFT_444018 [Russula compacta]|nr:hypothetical protein BJV74DRAFT_444018 [Russula compacta]
MPHTLLVSFSLLALVVTARPIAPVSDYSQPAEVQNAIKAIFEERTKQSNLDLFGFTQSEVDIRLISNEGQQAVLSQLDGSAVKALVPLGDTESTIPPEVQRLREMLGGSKDLDDIEGASSGEPTSDVEVAAHAVEELEPSGLTSTTPPSPRESARILTELSLTSLLAVCTLVSLAVVLYALYLIRGLFPQSQGEEEKQPLRPGDVESGHADEKSVATQEKVSDLSTILGAGTPRTSRPLTGVLVNIDEDIIVADGSLHDAVENDSSKSTPRTAPLEHSPVFEKPWLVPLPPSPPSSPLRLTVQLDGVAPLQGNSQPIWAMVASDEQSLPDGRTSDAAVAVDLALAMQLRTGFGATADAAWLIRFVMALFGWIAVLVGGGGERQVTGRRRLLGW